MKINFLSSKRASKVLFVLSLFFVSWLLTHCRDSEQEVEHRDVNVVFEVKASSGSKINAIVTQVGTAQNSLYNLTNTSWKSQGQTVNTQQGALHLSATATGDTADATLSVSIFVNGEKVATQSATGTDLVAKTSVEFQNVKIKQ